tara:strand:- start:1234 stop:1791 length:558 start_codon:yes stop_codon:yes gene_type:complete
MATLTEMVAYKPPGNRTLLYIEVPVSPGLEGPFMVSGSKRPFLWVRKFPTGIVRAAVRKVPWEFLFREALESIRQKCFDEEWGNWQPVTPQGVKNALAHLEEYDLPRPYDALHGVGFDTSLFPEGLTIVEAVWVPAGWAVILPEDRAFVGTTFDMNGGHRAMVVHNASRGLAVLSPNPESQVEEE